MAAYYKPNSRSESPTQWSCCFLFPVYDELSSPLASALSDVSDLAESFRDETLATQTNNIKIALLVSELQIFQYQICLASS